MWTRPFTESNQYCYSDMKEGERNIKVSLNMNNKLTVSLDGNEWDGKCGSMNR